VRQVHEIIEKATRCHSSQSPDQVQETGWKVDILSVMTFYGGLLLNLSAVYVMPCDHADGLTVKGNSMASSQKNTLYRKMSLYSLYLQRFVWMGAFVAYHAKEC
jgi:hypothetical protein